MDIVVNNIYRSTFFTIFFPQVREILYILGALLVKTNLITITQTASHQQTRNQHKQYYTRASSSLLTVALSPGP